MLKERYGSWDTGIGTRIDSGKESFASLEKYMLDKGDAAPNKSGRQELLENIINTYL
jgi:xylose isomerase